MMIGMTCLLLANPPRFIRIVAPGLIPASSPLSPDQANFAHGLLMGLSIGFLLLAVWRNAHKNDHAS